MYLRLADELLHDPVVQAAQWSSLDDLDGADALSFVEVAYKPGVTDNEAESVKIGAARLGIAGLSAVKTLRRYLVAAPGDAANLSNDLIQTAFACMPGDAVAKRVVFKPDARIQAIVKTWPVNFRTPRALAMGFKPDADVDSIIRDYIADEGIKPK